MNAAEEKRKSVLAKVWIVEKRASIVEVKQ